MYRFNRFSTIWISALTILGLCAVLQATQVVDLSNRHIKKEDFFVTMQYKIPLHNITDLILRQNEFDSFIDCSTKLDNLRKLDLSQNRLGRIFFLCKEEYQLEVLNLSHNHLEYIDDYALNDKIPKLKILDISSNRLTVVNETMLEHMKALEFFSVANNPLIEIHDKSFSTQRALLHLDLSNVSASSFPSSLFKPLVSLTFLNLSNNPIETIPLLPITLQELDLSGTNIQYPDNLLLPQLQSLNMNNMQKLTEIFLNEFQNLTMLDTLSFEGCTKLRIFRVYHSEGKLLPRLQRLSIRGCNVESLNADLRPIIQRTAVVDLSNNPWHCDCRMLWVNKLNLSTGFNNDMRCSSPDILKGKLLSEIPSENFICEEDNGGVVYPLIYAAVLILSLIMIAIIIIQIAKKKPISEWKLPMRGNSVSYKNVVESNNDLIRILNPGDANDRAEE